MAATIDSILTKVRRYNPQADTALLRRAYEYAVSKHEGQFRKTGEPYIMHPVEVVDILTGLEMDTPSLAAGFLHDVIEDCQITKEQLAADFGSEIAELVDGVTKLKLADFEKRGAAEGIAAETGIVPDGKVAAIAPVDPRRKKRMETKSSAENLRKILLAMARDFRVMVIKLGDRLHNMRTLQGLKEERQRKVSEETMQIFAPLAHRLGIWQIKWQLEDLAFKYLYPDEYEDIVEKIARTRRDREKDIKDAIYKLRTAFDEAGMAIEIQGRPKHLWSIRNKLRKNEIDINDLYDLIALRVIVGDRAKEGETPDDAALRERKSVADCYAALGVVHTVYMPIPGKFDDYIAKRKSNLYQSLHTKVNGPGGQRLEVQIRNWEMHRTSEFGVAAHWAYKEQGEGARAGQADFDRKMSFLRQQLFDWQQDAKNSTAFLNSVVSDLFTDQVFVFTPKGDVIDLPAGATPVDFAFRIHSSVGEHMVAAKVNGVIKPVSYTFQNGDIASIVTRPQANPSLDWLNLAKTSHAKTKIKHYFRRLRYADNVIRGRETLQEEIARAGLPVETLRDVKRMLPIANALNKTTIDDLFAAVGFGDVALGIVINRLRATITESEPEEKKKRGLTPAKLQITPGGVDGVAITRAKCCLPLPGDEVIGYVSRGKGLLLHRDGCPNVAQWRIKEPERLTEIDWQPAEGSRFETGIILETLDRYGLLRDVSEILSENRTFIVGINTRSDINKGTATMRIDFGATSTSDVDQVVNKLHSLEDLLSVHRLGVGAEEAPHPAAA